MGLILVKSVSDSSVFLVGVTVVAVVSLVIGYLTFNRWRTAGRTRVEFGLRAATNAMIAQEDLDESKLKARIIQTLTRNTTDLNMLNNSMNHVQLRIAADLQKDGPLHGLLLERSRGSVGMRKFDAKLAEYVKTLAASLNIPLMGRGRQPYGSMYGRTRNIVRRGRIARAFPTFVTVGSGANQEIVEVLDEALRRY